MTNPINFWGTNSIFTAALFLLSKHYRRPLDYHPRQLAVCAASLERIHQLLFRAVRLLNQGLNSAERGSLAAQDIASLRAARSEILKMCRKVLGIAVSSRQDVPPVPHNMPL